jgi:hypothetical protein
MTPARTVFLAATDSTNATAASGSYASVAPRAHPPPLGGGPAGFHATRRIAGTG